MLKCFWWSKINLTRSRVAILLLSWRLPTGPFTNFGASKSVVRRSWTTKSSPISWSWSVRIVKGSVGLEASGSCWAEIAGPKKLFFFLPESFVSPFDPDSFCFSSSPKTRNPTENELISIAQESRLMISILPIKNCEKLRRVFSSSPLFPFSSLSLPHSSLLLLFSPNKIFTRTFCGWVGIDKMWMRAKDRQCSDRASQLLGSQANNSCRPTESGVWATTSRHPRHSQVLPD